MEKRINHDRRVPRHFNGRLVEERTRRALSGMEIVLASADGRILSSARTGRYGEFELAVPSEAPHRREWEGARALVRHPAGQELASFLLFDLLAAGSFLELSIVLLTPDPDSPYITTVTPTELFPGSFVEIQGLNFGESYGDATVSVGGREALVLEHAPQLLLIRIPPLPGPLNPLVVHVAGLQAAYPGTLKLGVLPYSGEPGSSGPPMTFIGSNEVLE
jgi:hypothetical protein